ncbi:hypothetical protein LOD99_8348 [Oopsacas minuta]|uniref:Meiotic nuclear division protein 1 homolog n=1 Tax=Oopsacas minuta TaxID=111878 RepID=A0AAV7JH35_9METZ|nr:hypothetical protein LOD99_8348 [Oopsacas minuta]
MAKRKGLSLDDKRQKIMQIFAEKQEFFQLKEIEVLAKKEKGLNPMQVKDLVQSLVDDDMIDMEKVGISSYYWAFRSKLSAKKKLKLDTVKGNLKELEEKEKILKSRLESSKISREECEERDKISEEIEEKSLKVASIQKELEELKDSDPSLWEEREEEIKLALTAANRWTDNIFSLVSWCKSKFNMEEKSLNDAFGIPEDLDYVEN